MLFTNRRSSKDNLSVVGVRRNLWLTENYLSQCCPVNLVIFSTLIFRTINSKAAEDLHNLRTLLGAVDKIMDRNSLVKHKLNS